MTHDWIFILNSDALGEYKLQHAPDGWATARKNISRTKNWGGLFRKHTDSFKFYKDGKDYLQTIYENNGVEHEVRIGIYKHIQEYGKIKDKYILDYTGVVNFSTYKVDENYVEVSLHEDSFYQKIKGREKTKVKMSDTLSVDGEDIGEFQGNVDYKLKERKIQETATYIINPEIDRIEANHAFPLQIVDSSFEYAVEPSAFSLLDGPDQPLGTCIIQQPDKDISVRLYGHAKIYYRGFVASFLNARTEVWKIDEATLTRIPGTTTVLYDMTSEPNIDGYKEFDVDVSYTVYSGESLCIGSFNDSDPLAWEIIYNLETPEVIKSTFDLEVTATQIETVTFTTGALIHECFDRIVESYTGLRGRFKSDFFGRAELPLYTQDGEYSKSVLMTGLTIRGFDDSPSISLRDLFDGVSKMWGLSMGIERIDGFDYLVIEEDHYFYSNRVSTTLHDVNEISKEYEKTMVYNTIEVGYEKAEFEALNGLKEPNNKFEYSTIIASNNNPLNLSTMKIRTDCYGAELARRKDKETYPDEDTKYDNELFLMISEIEGDYYTQKLNINYYTTIQGVYSPDTIYNLDVTPARMLRNNWNKIRAGLEKYPDSLIKFIDAEQNSEVISQRPDELNPIIENANITVSELEFNLYKPETYHFEAAASRGQTEYMMQHMKEIIKFSPHGRERTKKYYYGWMHDVEINDEKGVHKFVLLPVNLKNPNFTIVDETGLDTSAPGRIVDVDPPLLEQSRLGFNYILNSKFDG